MSTRPRRTRRTIRAGAMAAGALLCASTGVGAAQAAAPVVDLVVTDITTVGAYTPGAPVVFQATIRNDGQFDYTTYTNGVAFIVDGRVVSWSDTNSTRLAPGQSVVVRANAGPAGTNAWKATTGKHTVRAWVDDVNRVPETNERNNTLDKTLTVSTGAVKAVTAISAKVAVDQAQYQRTHDRGVQLSWTAPAGQPAGTTYTVVEHPLGEEGGHCGAQTDKVRGTTTGTSMRLEQATGQVCGGGGHTYTYDSTFSVLASPPGAIAVDSTPSGACHERYQSASAWPAGTSTWWEHSCTDGGSVYDSVVATVVADTVVDAGGPGDAFFDGGQAVSTGFTGGPVQFQTARWGWSTYDIPVPTRGEYLVSMGFIDPTWWKAGQRVFDLSAERQPVAKNFDIAASVGRGQVVYRSAYVSVDDGNLTIQARKITDNPIISSIAVHRVN
ncbi:malectin domain-containing carbohydrate-binding protein [Kineococcus sp. SYSU DK005]|uniref:malectin domain-containing carbohydrate-binding protein n=1 Tax=Kineococcus sp. SYSU DK005 TaxID=3383126 RepID=UPI003D7C5503